MFELLLDQILIYILVVWYVGGGGWEYHGR